MRKQSQNCLVRTSIDIRNEKEDILGHYHVQLRRISAFYLLSIYKNTTDLLQSHI